MTSCVVGCVSNEPTLQGQLLISRYFPFILIRQKTGKSEKPNKNLKYFSREIWKISERNINQHFSELLQNLVQTIPTPVIEMVWHCAYSYNSCTAVYVKTVGKIFRKFKSMFLEVFFRFLSNFGDNFVKNPRKFWSYRREITRKIQNFGGNCYIRRHNSWEMLEKLAERNFKIFRKNFQKR